MLNELGGLAEGRGAGGTEQRTLDAKAALRWIRDMRDGREQGLAPPLKFLVFQTRSEYEQVRAPLGKARGRPAAAKCVNPNSVEPKSCPIHCHLGPHRCYNSRIQDIVNA